jgi:hypothetical protein
MRRRTLDERYKDNVRKQQRKLEDFAAQEIDWANNLLLYYRLKKLEISDDEYRACAFFINKEYLRKPGSLTLLYQMNNRCHKELPKVTKENAFDFLRFIFKMYAKVLETGGYGT